MYEKLDCIALRTVRYTDRQSILIAFSQQRGRLSFTIPAGNGREAARRRAILMPGNRFSCVSDIRPNSPVLIMRDVTPRGSLSLVSDPVKGAVTLFIADFINTLLSDSMPDAAMFNFCDSMLEALAQTTRPTANFHIMFMVRMMHFAGIEPDVSTYRDGYVFDLIEGIFRNSAPMHRNYLEPRQAALVALFMRINHRNMHLWKLSSAQRNEILDTIINYYTLHFANLRNMRSLQILRSLFV